MKIKPYDLVIVNCPTSKNHKLIGEVSNIPKTKKGHIWVSGHQLKFAHHYLPHRLQLYKKAYFVSDHRLPCGGTYHYRQMEERANV